MNNWETHDFQPSGVLKKGETHIDVYSNNEKVSTKLTEKEYKRIVDIEVTESGDVRFR